MDCIYTPRYVKLLAVFENFALLYILCKIRKDRISKDMLQFNLVANMV